MLNIVIPMAGKGSRFAEAGYEMPKPLINVKGRPMIELVINNIRPMCKHRFVFICQKEHVKKYRVDEKLREIEPDCTVIPIDYVTEGAACTVLLAEDIINTDDELMIANSDQYVDININEYISRMQGIDGLIMTMPANHPKWSYIRYNESGRVTLVREKEVISDQATVGIYNYRRGRDFCFYAKQMIDKNIRTNNEFYVAPVYNEMINDGMDIRFYDIGDRMHGLGTPEDLNVFLSSNLL